MSSFIILHQLANVTKRSVLQKMLADEVRRKTIEIVKTKINSKHCISRRFMI